MNRDIFENVGIKTKLFNNRIEGELYNRPEDFIVKEIQQDGSVYSTKKK